MHVVHVHTAALHVVAKVIRLAVHVAALDAAACHPHREAARMMVAAVVVLRHAALAVGRAPELAAPHDERVVEKAALGEVRHERCARLVGLRALMRDAASHAAVLIPSLVEQLHEPHTALDETTREQAVRGERPRLARGFAVARERRIALAAEIRCLGHAGLHAERKLGLLHARQRLGIAVDLRALAAHACQRVQHRATVCALDALWIAEEQHRVLARTERHALVFARQKARAPQTRVERLVARSVLRHEHDERGQVAILRAEPIAQPTAHRRTPRDLVAGAEERDRRIVVDRFGVHRAQHADAVRDLRGVRQQRTHRDAAFPVARERSERTRDLEHGLIAAHAGESLAATNAVRQRLAVQFAQLGFVVEGLELRRAAGLEQPDHALAPRQVMQAARWILRGGLRRILRAQVAAVERERSEREATGPQPSATR